ncbi:uncharacterized protein LOC132315623 [Cornus florida]|uniref:uncharacterized protein LOC132315623 n=1 Tax=Cornus florida TaxID=4283 RepID=UPI0028A25D25|nr:uncharacterized protein LOC132315623 [Cornus florida]
MKRLLVFYRETDLPTPWIMHEYHLVHSDDSIPNSTKKYSRAKDDFGWFVSYVRKNSDSDSDRDSEEMWVSGPCVMDLTSEEDNSELPQPSASSSSSSCSSGIKQPHPKESDQEVGSYCVC